MDYLVAARYHADQAAQDLRNELLKCALFELRLAVDYVERLLAEQEMT